MGPGEAPPPCYTSRISVPEYLHALPKKIYCSGVTFFTVVIPSTMVDSHVRPLCQWLEAQ
jgi:hypothetical protein